MQTIRILYLMESAQRKHETYAITYGTVVELWGPFIMQRSTACSAYN